MVRPKALALDRKVSLTVRISEFEIMDSLAVLISEELLEKGKPKDP